MDKCPICHNLIGVSGYTDDPILTPNNPYPEARGVTSIRTRHIFELQQAVNTYEAAFGISITIWSENTDVRWKHINELREAIEGILDAIGVSLQDFLSSDENGDPKEPFVTDWLDGHRLEKNQGVRGMHIEELRRQIFGGAGACDTIFCTTGEDNNCRAGLANASKEGENRLFRNFIQTEFARNHLYAKNMRPQTYYDPLVNTYDCMIFESNKLHLFSSMFFSGYGIPLYSYNNLDAFGYSGFSGSSGASGISGYSGYSGNIDFGSWNGFKTALYASSGYDEALFSDYVIRFNPDLPYNAPEDRGRSSQGILQLAVDDSDENDYYMYTVELFYERVGGALAGKTSADFGNLPSLDDSYAPNYIAKYKYPRRRGIGISDGLPNQTFSSSDAGVKIPIIDNSEIIYVNSQKWTKVASFSSSSADSTHYMINNSTGVVTFGNDSKGKIPPLNSQIVMYLTLFGGGIWEYVGIIAPRANGRYYFSVQAKNGKVWFNKHDNYVESVDVGIIKTTSEFSNTTHSITNNHGFITDETWQNNFEGYSADNHKMTLKGGVVITPNPVWSGLKGGFAQIRMVNSPTGIDGTGIRYVNDDPTNFEFEFSREMYNHGLNIYEGQTTTTSNNGFGLQERFIFIKSIIENIHYGTVVYHPADPGPPPVGEYWTFDTSTANSSIEITSTLIDRRGLGGGEVNSVVQLFNHSGTPTNPVLTTANGWTFTMIELGYDWQYEKTSGDDFYRLRCSAPRYTGDSTYSTYTWRRDNSGERLSGLMSSMKIRLCFPATSKSQPIYGGTNSYGSYVQGDAAEIVGWA